MHLCPNTDQTPRRTWSPQGAANQQTKQSPSAAKQVHSSTFHVNTIFRVFTSNGPFRDTGSQWKVVINLTQAELWLGLKRPWGSQEQLKQQVQNTRWRKRLEQ